MDKKNLNKIREDHGYTQEYMAEKLGISVAASRVPMVGEIPISSNRMMKLLGLKVVSPP